MLGVFPGIGLTDLTEHRSLPDVQETGRTFRDNACIKASAYARALGRWALADDSGLEVDHLSGKPGIYSARWAELHKAGSGNADNNALLLQQLKGVADHQRTAAYICVLALADAQGNVILTAEGTVQGQILSELRGQGGFGYDPLFFIESLGKTTGELAAAEKHRISHRGYALRRLASLMKRLNLAALA